MEVTHDYVDLETAKLLKKLEFDVPCQTTYNEEEEIEDAFDYVDSILFTVDDVNNASLNDFLVYLRPEHWQVIKWLRLKYNLHVHSVCTYNSKEYTWCVYIGHDRETYMPHWENEDYRFSSTSEEAELEAIKYCLNNLIDGNK